MQLPQRGIELLAVWYAVAVGPMIPTATTDQKISTKCLRSQHYQSNQPSVQCTYGLGGSRCPESDIARLRGSHNVIGLGK
jgi:hypothetical protein